VLLVVRFCVTTARESCGTPRRSWPPGLCGNC
jgi:hypothetical protein